VILRSFYTNFEAWLSTYALDVGLRNRIY